MDEATARRGIGCSEIADALSEPPWGCARRLVYKKRDTPPDYPVNRAMMSRGTAMEPLVADEWLSRYGAGRKLVRRQPVYHAQHPWLRSSVDREILGDPRGVGVWEAKTSNTHMYAKIKRDGLPAGYLLQVQGYLTVRQRPWAVVAVLCPDSWAMLEVPLERDDALIEAILPRLEAVWRAVEHGPLPDQLDPKDKRCQSCEFRRTCWGEGLALALPADDRGAELPEAPEVQELLADLTEAKAAAQEATEIEEAIKTKLKGVIGDRPGVRCDGYRVYFRASARTSIDTKLLKAKYPDVAKATERTTQVRALRVYAV